MKKREVNEESIVNLINMTPMAKNCVCDISIDRITITLNVYVMSCISNKIIRFAIPN